MVTPERAPRRAGTAASLRLAVVVVAVEAVGLLCLAAFLGGELVVSRAAGTAGAGLQALLAAAVGALLVVCARQLALHRRAARSPVLVWQVLQAAVALPTLTGGGVGTWVSVVLLALSVSGLVGLLSPATSVALDS